MSSFATWIKHPKTGKPVRANFLDNYFAKREYGVVIIGSKDTDPVYRENEVEIDKEAINKEEQALDKSK
ncbi:MAG: hypothetical protein U9O91_06040 [Candidatus Caldatribacteriota bacterium]|nr:hypothetical protein [Candidatus Caldatribacteriota bacterium]